jgi:hypothetical protein
MSLTRFWAGCCAVVLGLGAAGAARGTVFFTDGFGYENGTLTTVSTGVGDWVAHSSGGAGPIQVTDGKAIVLLDGGAEDVNRPLGATLQPGTTSYYAAKFTVTAGSSATINNNLYFLHFTDGGTFNFRGRLFLTQPNDPLNAFTLGVASSSTPSSSAQPGIKWATDLAYDTEYEVVVSYTTDDDDTNVALISDGFASLWINPVDQASTSVTDTNPNANVSTDLVEATYQRTLAIRQAGGTATQPVINLDVVSTATTFAEALAGLDAGPAVDDADFDGDGDIDGADYLTWQRGLGTTSGATLAQGDADGDGAIDADDLVIWRGQFATAVPAVGAVPEPASMTLLVACGLACVAASRRRGGQV